MKKKGWGVPEKINAYKRRILKEGRRIDIGGEQYSAMAVRSKRLTQNYGHHEEKLYGDDGKDTGEVKLHPRYALQIVKV